MNTEEEHILFNVCNGLVMSKELLYVTPHEKEKGKGSRPFWFQLISAALNGVHCDTGHQGQQRMLALTQERFWWPMMVEDC